MRHIESEDKDGCESAVPQADMENIGPRLRFATSCQGVQGVIPSTVGRNRISNVNPG